MDIKVLACQYWPSDDLIRKLKRKFGEGYTWTCPNCFQQFVLTQGKGNHWFWKEVETKQ